MTHDVVEAVEVVRQGTRNQIKHWCELLRKAKIRFEVRRFCDEHRQTRSDRAELWVKLSPRKSGPFCHPQ